MWIEALVFWAVFTGGCLVFNYCASKVSFNEEEARDARGDNDWK